MTVTPRGTRVTFRDITQAYGGAAVLSWDLTISSRDITVSSEGTTAPSRGTTVPSDITMVLAGDTTDPPEVPWVLSSSLATV